MKVPKSGGKSLGVDEVLVLKLLGQGVQHQGEFAGVVDLGLADVNTIAILGARRWQDTTENGADKNAAE